MGTALVTACEPVSAKRRAAQRRKGQYLAAVLTLAPPQRAEVKRVRAENGQLSVTFHEPFEALRRLLEPTTPTGNGGLATNGARFENWLAIVDTSRTAPWRSRASGQCGPG